MGLPDGAEPTVAEPSNLRQTPVAGNYAPSRGRVSEHPVTYWPHHSSRPTSPTSLIDDGGGIPAADDRGSRPRRTHRRPRPMRRSPRPGARHTPTGAEGIDQQQAPPPGTPLCSVAGAQTELGARVVDFQPSACSRTPNPRTWWKPRTTRGYAFGQSRLRTGAEIHATVRAAMSAAGRARPGAGKAGTGGRARHRAGRRPDNVRGLLLDPRRCRDLRSPFRHGERPHALTRRLAAGEAVLASRIRRPRQPTLVTGRVSFGPGKRQGSPRRLCHPTTGGCSPKSPRCPRRCSGRSREHAGEPVRGGLRAGGSHRPPRW